MELIINMIALIAFAYGGYLFGQKIGKERAKEERMRQLAGQHWQSTVRVWPPEGSSTSAEQLTAAARRVDRAMRRNI